MRRVIVHWWNTHDPRPFWACGAGMPVQGQEWRQSTHAFTCKRCKKVHDAGRHK